MTVALDVARMVIGLVNAPADRARFPSALGETVLLFSFWKVLKVVEALPECGLATREKVKKFG